MGELRAVCTDGSIRYLDTQLKGAATGVLLFFLLNVELCFSEEDLRFYTGYSRPTLHSALRSLARFELVQQLGERKMWTLTARVRQLDFRGVALPDGEKNIFSPSSSSSISTEEELLLQPTTSTLQPEKSFSTEVAELLQAAGVFAAQAQELAGDPWVTVERVEAWVLRLRKDESVRSVGAVLYTNLRHHLEPGTQPEKPDPLPFLCPVCRSRPCMCEELGFGKERELRNG